MLFASSQRYFPRSGQDRERSRREAELRAQVADLTARISALEREQHVQFKRTAEIQLQLDEITRLLKRLTGAREQRAVSS